MSGYNAVALLDSSHVVSVRDSEVGSRGARCGWKHERFVVERSWSPRHEMGL